MSVVTDSIKNGKHKNNLPFKMGSDAVEINILLIFMFRPSYHECESSNQQHHLSQFVGVILSKEELDLIYSVQ